MRLTTSTARTKHRSDCSAVLLCCAVLFCCCTADTAVEQFCRWLGEHPAAAHSGMVSYESLAVEELRLIQTRLSLRPMDRISKLRCRVTTAMQLPPAA